MMVSNKITQFLKRKHKYITYLIIITIIIILITSIFIFSTLSKNKSKPIKIGIVDSGCNEDQNVKKYITYTNTSYGYYSDDTSPYDKLGHGTTVCKIILEDADVPIEIFSAKIAHYDGTLTYQGLFAAINWLVQNNVDIINLSLGSEPFYTSNFTHSFEKYADKILFVAAAGNTGSSLYNSNGLGDWPAILPWVVGVGASSNTIYDRAVYSASGRGYYGTYVSEFSAPGKYDKLIGTSMSTPQITAHAANIMYVLREKNYDFTIDNIIALMAKTSAFWGVDSNLFDITLGWGSPYELDITKLISPTLVIDGSDFYDTHTRFTGEQWIQTWKINTLDLDTNEINFSSMITGNASSSITDIKLDSYEWGSLLTIGFQGQSTGKYIMNIENKYGNPLKYTYYINGTANGKILFDFRTSINGYGHEYGIYTQLDNIIRNKKFIVNYNLNNTVNLEKYDAVIAPNLFQQYRDTSILVYRNSTVWEDYIRYISDGGVFLGMVDRTDDTHVKTLNDYINPIGLNYTSYDIKSTSSTTKINNFTDSYLTEGMVSMNFLGGEINIIDQNNPNTINNASYIGWYQEVIMGPVSIEKYYRSIGIQGYLNNGELIIIGSSYSFTNKNLIDLTHIHSDRLIENLINHIMK